MVTKLKQFIGDQSQFAMEHRLFNMVLIFAMVVSLIGVISNYLLNLGFILVLISGVTALFMAGLYYLSTVKKQYKWAVSILLISGFVIFPVLWVLNGGVSGSLPMYIVMFATMGANIFLGFKKYAIMMLFMLMAILLIFFEYQYPQMIIGYVSESARYIDILIAVLLTIFSNTIIFVIVLKLYNQEHEKANKYLAQSQEAQDNLLYLSYHDVLTGLYNRTYFEQELTKCEHDVESGIGIFVIDLDRLKFVNDTFGHEQGDAILIRASKVLQASFRPSDIVARIGGDEFAIMVRGLAAEEMEVLYKRLRDNMNNENEKMADISIPLSISAGYAYMTGEERSIRALLSEADKKMYREKLYRQAGMEGSIIQTVKSMLVARDYETGVHCTRLQELIARFALVVGIPESEIADIQLFAEFHDVGKIGIPDDILHKKTELTKAEREKIQRHCEIGFRIAKASTDLLPIADWILKHHEWWDGEGYPLGIYGEIIPVECRIVAIADSYDAMTHNRPYRVALSHKEALEELRRCAGTQFDPVLVEKFIALVQ